MTADGRGSAMQSPYDAVIFDMDGVVTDTASVHAAAWKLLFDEVLSDPRAAVNGPVIPFDSVEDYRRYVDGRAREDGWSRSSRRAGLTCQCARRRIRPGRGRSTGSPPARTTSSSS